MKALLFTAGLLLLPTAVSAQTVAQMTGDCTLSGPGAITCVSLQGGRVTLPSSGALAQFLGTTAQLLDGAGNPVTISAGLNLNSSTHVLTDTGGGGGGGGGTVTAVSVASGLGLTITNPNTTPQIGGTLSIANGGTGSTSAAAALTALGGLSIAAAASTYLPSASQPAGYFAASPASAAGAVVYRQIQQADLINGLNGNGSNLVDGLNDVVTVPASGPGLALNATTHALSFTYPGSATQLLSASGAVVNVGANLSFSGGTLSGAGGGAAVTPLVLTAAPSSPLLASNQQVAVNPSTPISMSIVLPQTPLTGQYVIGDATGAAGSGAQITMVANTNWTIVGNPVIASNNGSKHLVAFPGANTSTGFWLVVD